MRNGPRQSSIRLQPIGAQAEIFNLSDPIQKENQSANRGLVKVSNLPGAVVDLQIPGRTYEFEAVDAHEDFFAEEQVAGFLPQE